MTRVPPVPTLEGPPLNPREGAGGKAEAPNVITGI